MLRNPEHELNPTESTSVREVWTSSSDSAAHTDPHGGLREVKMADWLATYGKHKLFFQRLRVDLGHELES